MFENLEGRRLFAASAALTAGTLRIAGTDESDVISITYALALKGGTAGSGVSVDGRYVVSVNDDPLGTFTAKDVTRINVFGLGGNDKITGPSETSGTGSIRVISTGEDGSYTVVANPTDGDANVTVTGPVATAALYIEGGSGRDFIQGGAGNDTLKGGSGDDVILGGSGRNTLDGGKGDDTLNARLVSLGESSASSKRIVSELAGKSRNRVIGGAGNDFALLGRLDVASADLENNYDYVRDYTRVITGPVSIDELEKFGWASEA